MTLELVFYVYLLFVAIIFCFVRINDKVYYSFTVANFVVLSFIVRYSGFDADIGNYAEYLKINSLSIYYLKEPVYWLGSRVIYSYTNSPITVFLFYDLIFIVTLLLSCSKLKLPRYFPYLVILFFPTVLGMQNVLRQFIAGGFLFFLMAMIFTSQKFRYRFFVLILAMLTHNVSLLFLPLVFISFRSRHAAPLFVFSSICVLLLLPFAAGTKSDSNTGDLPPYLYFIIYSLMIFTYLAVLKFDLKKCESIYRQFFNMQLYLLFLIFLGMFVLGGAQSKRVGMLSLLLSLLPLVLLIEQKFKQRVLLRIVLVIVLVLPTFVFHNARSLLQTNELSLKIEEDARALNHH